MKLLLCSKLSRTWLFIWLIGISTYLSVKSLKRYLKIKTWQFETAEKREFSNGILTMYLTSIIIGISSSLCCVFCILVKTGNYANDSAKFGVKSLDFKTLRIKLHREEMDSQFIQANRKRRSQFWIRMKHHFPAFYCCFYFVMSFSFISVLPYVESEEIRMDLEHQRNIWFTNLDVMFNTYPMNDDPSRIAPISPEFFNICISLIVHAFSYGSVFWKFNRYFSFIFTVFVFINGLLFILDFGLLEMLIKISKNADSLKSLLKNSEQLEFQWTPLISLLSIMSYLFMLVSQLSLFEYGYNRVKDALIKRPSNDMNDNCPTYINGSNVSTKVQYAWKQLCIESWGQIMKLFVIGIIATIFSILVKLPYLYKSMKILYTNRNSDIVLTNVVVSILYLVSTVILWTYLILKSNWSIHNYRDPIPAMNGECNMFIPKPSNEIITIPVYASVNRHPPSSPPVDQEPNLPLFCDKMATQWRYSCSPASCAPNDSNSNSDRTVSGKNQDIGNKKNYIYLSRINPGMDSPNFSQGIYSQLVKLTPQLSLTDNMMDTDNTAVPIALSNEASDNSSNQTVHIIGPSSTDLSRCTIERASIRNRPEINSEIAPPEYFNIISTNSPLIITRHIYEQTQSSNADAESNNLCTQV